jgi:ribonuclease BN (tRNA processing enzyme)
MRVHVLGCGDAFGSGGRNQSAYLVEAADRLFLLDCGPAALPALKRAGFDPGRLDAVFLSHLHGDHCAGLPFFFIEYLYQRPRSRPLIVAGPPGTEERLCGLFGLMYGGAAAEKEIPPTRFHVLNPGSPACVEGIDIVPFRVPHQTDQVSLGLKIGYDKKEIVFSGDSAWDEIFVERVRGADLFLCECSFYEHGAGNHVNFVTLEANLPRLECKQVVLVHLGEEMIARGAQPGVTLAEDGMVLEI